MWADWKAKCLTIVNCYSHAPIKTKRVNYVRQDTLDDIRPAEGYAHRNVAKLKAINSNDPQDSGLCTKGYVIGSKLPNKVPLVTDDSSYADSTLLAATTSSFSVQLAVAMVFLP